MVSVASAAITAIIPILPNVIPANFTLSKAAANSSEFLPLIINDCPIKNRASVTNDFAELPTEINAPPRSEVIAPAVILILSTVPDRAPAIAFCRASPCTPVCAIKPLI